MGETETGHGAHTAARLALDLGEMARVRPGALTARLRSLPLRELAELALRLPAKERLELLLHAPQPMRLVRALPDEDVYLTVRELGPLDALPILALASASQIIHLLDLESWRRDAFDAHRVGAWTALLVEAGEPTLLRFLKIADESLLALLFARWTRIRPIEAEGGPPIEEHAFASPDGDHVFHPEVPEHARAVRLLAELFFREQRQRYAEVVYAALWELPSELEEQALHWRGSRLEERGYPPWDEALTIYLAPSGERSLPQPPAPGVPEGLAAPRTALRVLGERSILAAAMDQADPGLRERLLHELAFLSNRILVADAADLGDPGSRRDAMERAAGHTGIALAARGARDGGAAAAVLREVPILELFREGLAQVAALADRARRLVQGGWAAAHPRALELLDPPLETRILGLTRPRQPGTDPPEGSRRSVGVVRSVEDLEEARVALEVALVLGRVFVERLGLDIEGVLRVGGSRQPRFSTLLLTALAWHEATGAPRCEPVPPAVAESFLLEIASLRAADPEEPGRVLERFVERLARDAGLAVGETGALRAFGRACLEPLFQECIAVDPDAPINLRSVSCLLVRP